MEFKDLTCWITGASSGIGLALAKSFANRDATVILSSRSKEKILQASKIIGEGHRVFILPCDVTNSEQIRTIYEKITLSGLNVNLLVNNAGVYFPKRFVENTLEDFDATFDTLVRGAFLCTQMVLPSMINANFGIIINIISIVVDKIFPNSSVYSAAKSAVMMMGKVLREEVRPNNIKIMNVYPGATSTNIWSPKILDKFAHKMMKPEQVADSIVCNISVCLENGVMIEELTIRPQSGDL